jgi:hypothetical protein
MNSISQNIYQQLGGNKFMAMTGAKNLIWSNSTNTLSMHLPRNNAKAQRLCITYNSSSDLYTMTFTRSSKNSEVVTAEFDNVYGDQMGKIFAKTTGLYTSL